jgi:glycosyltransferase involved in cell wall biosynthesis
MIELARGLGIRRMRLWPKAVDSDRFRPGAATAAMRQRLTGGQPQAPLIVYAGRVSFEKRVDTFADAVRQLHAAKGGARFAVVGDGPALEWLKQRLAGTPTIFTGFLQGDELADAYASGDLFAFPSDSETLGFAAIEAMAAGTAVVAADAGGIPHIVKHGVNGVLVPPGRGDALAQKLGELIGDRGERERLAQAGRAEALRWSWDAATMELVTQYRSAVRVHARSSL